MKKVCYLKQKCELKLYMSITKVKYCFPYLEKVLAKIQMQEVRKKYRIYQKKNSFPAENVQKKDKTSDSAHKILNHCLY